MPHAHTIPATQEHPLYVPNFPMYNGRFTPHIFWHKAIPGTSERPHQEEIWFSMYREDSSTWSKPKRISPPKSTICLINYDTTKSPSKLSFVSLFISPNIHALEYAGHQQYTSLRSLTKEQLHSEPTTLDIFELYSNPNHFFSPEQHHVLSAAMLKRYPSTHPDFIQCQSLWSTHNVNRPTQCTTWQTHPIVDTNGFITPALPPTQIIQTSASRPYIVDNYPYSYGDFRKARFWVETTEKTKTKKRKEVGFMQTLCPSTSTWTQPKAMSAAKASLCLMHIQNNIGPTFGLPFFSTVTVREEDLQNVLDFAINLDHYFTATQQSLITEFLMAYHPLVSPQIEQLRSAWANRPTVPEAT